LLFGRLSNKLAADLAINAASFRGLNCRAWAALADHRKNERPTSE
jgi:hypothetical protein